MTKTAKPMEPKNIRNIDIRIGIKIYQMRLSLGMTRQQLATKISITHQQLLKYEKGINRIAISRLADIAAGFNVPVTYFFDEPRGAIEEVDTSLQRQCMDFMRDFINIENDNKRNAVKALVKAMAAG